MSDDAPHEQDANRNADGTFVAGVSGNPGGRPKGSTSLKTMLRSKLAESDSAMQHELIEATIRDAINGDSQSRKLVWEYMEGKPTATVDLHAEVTTTEVDIEALKAEYLEALTDGDA